MTHATLFFLALLILLHQSSQQLQNDADALITGRTIRDSSGGVRVADEPYSVQHYSRYARKHSSRKICIGGNQISRCMSEMDTCNSLSTQNYILKDKLLSVTESCKNDYANLERNCNKQMSSMYLTHNKEISKCFTNFHNASLITGSKLTNLTTTLSYYPKLVKELRQEVKELHSRLNKKNDELAHLEKNQTGLLETSERRCQLAKNFFKSKISTCDKELTQQIQLSHHCARNASILDASVLECEAKYETCQGQLSLWKERHTYCINNHKDSLARHVYLNRTLHMQKTINRLSQERYKTCNDAHLSCKRNEEKRITFHEEELKMRSQIETLQNNLTNCLLYNEDFLAQCNTCQSRILTKNLELQNRTEAFSTCQLAVHDLGRDLIFCNQTHKEEREQFKALSLEKRTWDIERENLIKKMELISNQLNNTQLELRESIQKIENLTLSREIYMRSQKALEISNTELMSAHSHAIAALKREQGNSSVCHRQRNDLQMALNEIEIKLDNNLELLQEQRRKTVSVNNQFLQCLNSSHLLTKSERYDLFVKSALENNDLLRLKKARQQFKENAKEYDSNDEWEKLLTNCNSKWIEQRYRARKYSHYLWLLMNHCPDCFMNASKKHNVNLGRHSKKLSSHVKT